MAIRVVIPDSHGAFISRPAMQAFLLDLKQLDPEEIVMLGDHVDCSGVFSSHKRSYKEEMEYSYLRDIEYARVFLDAIQENAPRARIHYLLGNHEQRVEKWAVDTFDNMEDVSYLLSKFSPVSLLDLDKRGIKHYRMGETYGNLTQPGTIQLGKCFFVHGIVTNKHAAASHVERFGANVVFGHTHRAQSHVIRTVTSGEIGAWCPGTLSELQPMWLHSSPSNWTNGYGVQLVNKGSGTFLHINVPIVKGQSLLKEFIDRTHSPNPRKSKD